MGKTRRRLTSPKFATKYANLRAAIARRKGEVEPEPISIVEEVCVVTKPEPIVEEPVPKATKKAPTKRKATTKRKTTKKTTTKKTKRSTVKKDK
tara:strand:+ start:298 stop:579 length:282 start_codon:yes stop_codon:yes gene_type:complete